MTDEEFSQRYVLTVFPFSRDVFLYVPRATVDLSVFGGDPASLIRGLRSAHRSIRFQASPLQNKASIEGPFSAVQALREDLIRRASCITASSQPADGKLKNSPPSPRLASQNSPASSRSTEAKQEVASRSLQNAGRGQSLISKQKTPTGSSRQKVSNESLTGGRLRLVEGEEVGAGMVSSAGPKRIPGDSCHDPSGSDQIPAIPTGADYLKHPSSPMRNSRFPQDRLGKDWTLSAGSADASKDVWVDFYTFSYIEQFHKKDLTRCLSGVSVSAQPAGAGLMRLSLTEKRPSASRTLQDALENLETLIRTWQSKLRVQDVFYNKSRLLDEQKLIQFCRSESSVFHDVLYLVEGSSVKVIGPSVSSYHFCEKVRDWMVQQPFHPRNGSSRS